MNKKDLITKVADYMATTTKDAEFAVNAVVDTIADALNNGDKVSLTGFGVFEVVKRNARRCRNMKSGEMMTVPEKMAPKFRAAKSLKLSVSEIPVA